MEVHIHIPNSIGCKFHYDKRNSCFPTHMKETEDRKCAASWTSIQMHIHHQALRVQNPRYLSFSDWKVPSQKMQWRSAWLESLFAILRWNDYRGRFVFTTVMLYISIRHMLACNLYFGRHRCLSAEEWNLLRVDKLCLYEEKCWLSTWWSSGNKDILVDWSYLCVYISRCLSMLGPRSTMVDAGEEELILHKW